VIHTGKGPGWKGLAAQRTRAKGPAILPQRQCRHVAPAVAGFPGGRSAKKHTGFFVPDGFS
jgi:hypothetical protein